MELKLTRKFTAAILIAAVVVFGGCAIYQQFYAPVVLQLGLFVGSNWNVPDWQSYNIIDEAIKRFEQENPRIKIIYRSGTLRTDYSEWLAQQIVQGKEPDIFFVLPEDFNTFASIGILQKLDLFIQKDQNFNINKMYKNAIKSGNFQGSQYALPRELMPVLMFVNKTLLHKQNIAIPKEDWTWDTFYEICKKVTKDTDRDGEIDQFGMVEFNWKHAVYANNQVLFNSEGSQAFFDHPRVIEAVNFIVKLNRLNQNYKPLDFDSGKVAFTPFPFSSYRAYKYYPYKVKRFAQFEWESIKLPRGPHGKHTGELHSLLMAMSARTQHQKEAWKFLKFMTYDNEVQMNIFSSSYGVPVLKEVAESKQAEETLATNNLEGESTIDTKMLSEVIENSTVIPRFKKYDEVMNIADKEIFKLINEEADIDNTLTKLNREINKYLQQ